MNKIIYKNAFPHEHERSDFIYHSIEKLDLRVPDDFLTSLLFIDNIATGIQPNFDNGWRKQFSVVECVHPLIFQLEYNPAATSAVWSLFLNLNMEPGTGFRRLRAESLATFRTAYRQGLIGADAYGAAIRCAITLADGNPTPWHPAGSLSGRRDIIREMGVAGASGLMSYDELQRWKSLPERLTIYRGGCSGHATRADAFREGARGIFWTEDLETAQSYCAMRSSERIAEGKAGWPYFIKAEVDRSAVVGVGLFGELREMFVDFDAIRPGAAQCILPRDVLAA